MPLKSAVIQLNANDNKEHSVRRAQELVMRAVKKDAKFILLPEAFNYRGNIKTVKGLASVSETIPGPSIKPFLDIAKRYKVNILE